MSVSAGSTTTSRNTQWPCDAVFGGIHLIISKIEQKGTDVFEITADTGAAFYLRAAYLRFVAVDELFPGAEILEAAEDDVLASGLAFAAERAAVSLLERSEQCRAGLSKKLLSRGFEKNAVAAALDYLEGRDFLSDGRFARAWLNGRRIAKAEGKTRLLAELASRGISREVSQKAVAEFFEENDEGEICERALKKMLRQKKSGEKLVAAMQRAGFSLKMIQQTIEKNGDIL